jgi:RND family efflux transporter MFP subunit
MVNEKRLSDTQISAPFSGIINRVFTQENTLIGPGKPVFELVDISGFEITIGLTETEVSQLSAVHRIETELLSFPDELFPSSILETAVKANHSLQYEVKLALEVPDSLNVLAGMVATVHFILNHPEEHLALPVSAIHGDIVWINDNGKARKKRVTTAGKYEDWVYINSGIQPGNEVIISSPVHLREGINLIVKN